MKRQQSSSSGDRKRDGSKSKQQQQESGRAPGESHQPKQERSGGMERDVERVVERDDEDMDRR
jgi:hypothetical protein